MNFRRDRWDPFVFVPVLFVLALLQVSAFSSLQREPLGLGVGVYAAALAAFFCLCPVVIFRPHDRLVDDFWRLGFSLSCGTLGWKFFEQQLRPGCYHCSAGEAFVLTLKLLWPVLFLRWLLDPFRAKKPEERRGSRLGRELLVFGRKEWAKTFRAPSAAGLSRDIGPRTMGTLGLFFGQYFLVLEIPCGFCPSSQTWVMLSSLSLLSFSVLSLVRAAFIQWKAVEMVWRAMFLLFAGTIGSAAFCDPDVGVFLTFISLPILALRFTLASRRV